MSSTPQTQAIGVINQLISLAAQLLSINEQMTVIDAVWNDVSLANTINALQTATLNADGSLGAADAAPNTAHPLNIATYPQLTRALSAVQVTQIKTVLDNVVTYVGGGAVPATASARGVLNSASGI